MSMSYIRGYYKVPAKRGGRVGFDGRLGTITSADGAQLRVRLDGDKHPVPVHPTWRMTYLGVLDLGARPPRPAAHCEGCGRFIRPDQARTGRRVLSAGIAYGACVYCRPDPGGVS